MKNKMEDVRNHLVATLEALLDQENPMDLERAKTVSVVAQTLINSAKVEVEFIREVGGKGSGFMPAPQEPTPITGPKPRLIESK